MASKSKWQRRLFFPETPPKTLEGDRREAFVRDWAEWTKNDANRFARAKRRGGSRVRVVRLKEQVITLVMWRTP